MNLKNKIGKDGSNQGEADQKQELVLNWDCYLKGIAISDSNSQTQPPSTPAITVGTPLKMVCSGEPILFNSKNLKILLDEKQKYILKVLRVEKISPTQVELIVVSYQAGNHRLESFQLFDGKEFVESGPLAFQVSSVLKKDSKPYGPFGPIELKTPSWFWMGLGFLGVLLLVWMLIKARKWFQTRRIIKKMELHKIVLSPYNQFNKELRQIDRDMTFKRQKTTSSEQENKTHRKYLLDMEKSFRIYLSRELKVPALDWSDKEIMKQIKRRHRKIFVSSGEEILKLLQEFNKLTKGDENLSLTDFLQMKQLCRDCSDGIYKTLSEIQGGLRK